MLLRVIYFVRRCRKLYGIYVIKQNVIYIVKKKEMLKDLTALFLTLKPNEKKTNKNQIAATLEPMGTTTLCGVLKIVSEVC